MSNIKRFLANKKPGFYVLLAAFVLGLVGLITYVARGGNYLSPVSKVAVILWVFAEITSLLCLVDDLTLLGFVPVALFASVLGVLLNSEMLFITNVGFGVDNNSFDGAFFVFLICAVLATLTSAVAYGMGISKTYKLLADKE